ncbi:polysaccharide lyase 8 family protein [Streptomyces violascens]|uniref:Lyase n=1 Tax=Streptomyces violascens TaxID=67381 RepID=A0ABQ3QZJ8_9ACTN|nr:polysaccharide lyase 8 family protein [Streptomyces violascens]GGU15793.1 lyase [Streptomyces violascens]GHI42693.1 lyase [Streptomyces violascens]
MPSAQGSSRRTFLAASGTGAAAVALGLTLPAQQAAASQLAPAADEFDTLRLRWRELMLGSGFDATAEPYATKLAALGTSARTALATMAPASGSLWPDLPLTDAATGSAGMSTSYGRLNTMAQAWAQPGTGSTGDATLIAAVGKGLDHLYTQIYNENTKPFGNWWDWQIGSSRLLMDTAVIVYDTLTADRLGHYTAAIDHFVPDSAVAVYSGTSTGANRTDLCRVLATRGVLGKNAAKIALARDALSPVFPYVTAGDGLYADGSFIQHTWIAYTGSYGEVQIDGLSRLFALLAGSTWAVTDPNRQIILDSVERSYAPLIHDGLMMDCVNGRAISRQTTDDQLMGRTIMAHIAMLALGASPAERDRWRALIKGWTDRAQTTPVLADQRLSVANLALLRAAVDAAPTAAPAPVGPHLFPAMDRAVHRGSRFAASLSMSSSRIAYYENGNGENLRGWHTGSGMLAWWGDGFAGDQYSDGFWPTADPYRMPGTTVSRKPLADGEGGAWGAARPAVTWVGGAGDGTYAAVGQHLKGLSSTLTARKSWFFVGDEIVCLGAGITAADGMPVESVVDHRNLGATGTNALTVDGRRLPTTLGRHDTFPWARWAHLAGHGGYVFPGGAAVQSLREERTGTWRAINTGGTADPVTRRYLTLWFAHGTDPADATYAYVLLPGARQLETAVRAADHDKVRVLANSPSVQAISSHRLGLLAANFWTAGAAGELAVNGPASALVRTARRTATLSLAAPERTGAPVELIWDRPVRSVASRDPRVEVLATGRSLRLRITPDTACGTVRTDVVLG